MRNFYWLRNDSILHRAKISNDSVTAGLQIRDSFDLIRRSILETDTIVPEGDADFGFLYDIALPACTYNGQNTRWYTHTMIDGVSIGPEGDLTETKGAATCGFHLSEGDTVFNDFLFGGDCQNPTEDGGLLGWDEAMAEDASVVFNNCDIDASQGFDWGVYSWENADRRVTINGGTSRFCRFLVAMAGSGTGGQHITMNDVRLFGDANGSRSLGASSLQGGGDPDAYAVLTPALNRGGAIALTDCISECRGLTAEYSSSYGCPRICALGTNKYYSTASGEGTQIDIVRCRSTIIPGTARWLSDIEIRGAAPTHDYSVEYDTEKVRIAENSRNARAIALARGLSGEGGRISVYRTA